jgi:hypothetical protein
MDLTLEVYEDILINILIRLDLKYLYHHYYKPYHRLINTQKGLYLLGQIHKIDFSYTVPINLTQLIFEYDFQYQTNILSSWNMEQRCLVCLDRN